MRVNPVEKYFEPRYPIRQLVDDCPELLWMVPRRWQANPVVLSALAGMCALMLGSCVLAANEPAVVSKVAPVFEHGDGRGTFGCVAINPPVFLSEDEARQVVMEEAKRQGIDFSVPGPELSDVLMPTYKEDDTTAKPENKPLTLDGQDTKRKIFFEFVSLSDLISWEKQAQSPKFTSNAIATASLLRSQLHKTELTGTYGVFYDPLVRLDMDKAPQDEHGRLDWNEWSKMRSTQGKQMAKDELRKQVQDFIKWLKTQGVI